MKSHGLRLMELREEYYSKLSNELFRIKPEEIQKIISLQLKEQNYYYNLILEEAKRNFDCAKKLSYFGVLFFVIPIIILAVPWVTTELITANNSVVEIANNAVTNAAIISAIIGGLIEIIALTIFYFYGKNLNQLDEFHARLDINLRVLLANSICDQLKDDLRQKAPAKIKIIESLIEYENKDNEESS